MTQVFKFRVLKTNKHDKIYEGFETNIKSSFITDLVKIEKFQGYSNAHNLDLYFRVRDKSSWSKSTKVTGLWKLNRRNFFYGDRKTIYGRTLIVFKIEDEIDELTIYVFQQGYYPSRTTIESLSMNL